jgi:hypothetical protein
MAVIRIANGSIEMDSLKMRFNDFEHAAMAKIKTITSTSTASFSETKTASIDIRGKSALMRGSLLCTMLFTGLFMKLS